MTFLGSDYSNNEQTSFYLILAIEHQKSSRLLHENEHPLAVTLQINGLYQWKSSIKRNTKFIDFLPHINKTFMMNL